MKHWYLGTIGFSYKDWVGPFYPAGTTQRGYLPYYSKVFNAVELDTTFHSIPQQSTVQSWFTSTPEEFRICLKTPRRITHELGLKGTQRLMLEFIDSLQPLGEKQGPILIQLPPKFSQVYYSVLNEFLESLPKTHQFAIEFRHASWYNQKTTQLLNQHQVSWVANDFPNLPKEINLTANFVYIRWIGVNSLYQHHTHERVDRSIELRLWVEQIYHVSELVRNVYGFFNNDYAGFAVGTGKRFKLIAGLTDQEDNLPYQSMFI